MSEGENKSFIPTHIQIISQCLGAFFSSRKIDFMKWAHKKISNFNSGEKER